MRQTFFYIPHELLGLPVLGWGWLLAVWLLFGVGAVLWLWRQRGWDADTRGVVPVILVIAAVIVFVLPHLEARSPTGRPLGAADSRLWSDVAGGNLERSGLGSPPGASGRF